MQKRNITKKRLNNLLTKVKKELSVISSSSFLSFTVPVVIVLLFIIFGLVLLNLFRYQINPDATSYIQIAKHYAAGDIRQAINGYWSPLLSWLLVPFVWLHIDLQLAAKIISLTASLGTLLIVWYLLTKQKIIWWISATILIIASALLLNWTLAGPITGDLLFLLFVFITPILTVRLLKNPSIFNAFLLGMAGSLIYFSKAIGFYVFIVYLAIVFIYEKQYNLRSAKKYLITLLFFLVLIAPFVAAISYKDRSITISTASRYNIELAKRFSPNQSEYLHPMNWQNILFPLASHQNIVHEDPDLLTNALKNTFPITRHEALENYYKNILNNVHSLLVSTYIFAIIFGIGFLLYSHQKSTNNTASYHPLLAYIALVSLGGVLLSIYELRYIYPTILASFIGIAMLLQKSRKHIPVVWCCAALGILAIPIYNNTFQNAYTGYSIYLRANTINSQIPKGSNIVSDESSALYFCYYGQFRCVGNTVPTKNNIDEMNKQLKLNNVQYYLVINPDTLKEFNKSKIQEKLGVKVITTFVD